MTICLKPFSRCFIAMFFLVMSGSFSVYAMSEIISLKLKTGDLIFTGHLIAFNGKSYVIKSTRYGQVTLDARKFDCVSESCKVLKQFQLGQSKKVTKQKKPYISFLGLSRPEFGIYGSNVIGSGLMPELIKGFAQRNGYRYIEDYSDQDKGAKITLVRRDGKIVSRIDLKHQASSSAFQSLRKNQALIGMSDRPINDGEITEMVKSGYAGIQTPGQEHVIGIDSILVLTSPRNPLTSLSRSQIAGIFSGRIKNWAEVGGRPGAINMYAPENRSATFGTFKALILEPYKWSVSEKARRYASNAEISEKVYADPNGIGIARFTNKGKANALAVASTCGMTHPPTQFNVSTDEYPFSRRLYLYTTKAIRNKYAAGLLNFSKDMASTRMLLKQHGFISRAIHLQPFHEQSNRLSAFFASGAYDDRHIRLIHQFAGQLKKASRLSFTVRFHPNSSEFDSESQQLFSQLGRFIISNKLEKNYFIMVGFSDSVGTFDKNLQLSHLRAKQVAEKFRAATKSFIKPNQIIARAYGELLPVSCNDTPQGKRRNRRVEIWTVKPEYWQVQPIYVKRSPSNIPGKISATAPARQIKTPLVDQ